MFTKQFYQVLNRHLVGKRTHLLIAVLLLLPRAPSIASPTIYDVDFCGWYQVSFADDAGSLPLGSPLYDYWTTNANRPTRGAKIKVLRNSDGAVVHNDFTPWTGSDAGCTGPISLASTESYEVRIYASAEVHGNTIKVKNNDTLQQVWYSVAEPAYRPTADITEGVFTGSHAAWNIAASAGWAMKRRNGGINGETFVMYTQACPSGGTNCTSAGEVYLNVGDSKFVNVHELGYALGYFANGGVRAAASTGLADPTCPAQAGSHDLNSLEWQSGAANEGFASYYAAVAWNQTQETNCTYVLTRQWADWNLDGIDNDVDVFSCEGAVPGESDAEDYAGEFCSPSSNQGTQLDWMRFFWDLDNKEGLNTTDIVNIWVGSAPENWTSIGVGSGPGYPSWEMRSSAAVLLFDAAWGAQMSNGVTR